ncbi:hypothetical protein [Planococcus sp. YIM B11945]|uniref:hypothetical protein n=1 Tax=Planococcus sp. YIM B11945 TaxID=3435410 RepID=UPI003D7DDC8B
MERSRVLDFIFEKDSYRGVKMSLSILFIIGIFAISRMISSPLFVWCVITPVLLLTLAHLLVKLLWYNKKIQKKGSPLDVFWLVICAGLLVWAWFSI